MYQTVRNSLILNFCSLVEVQHLEKKNGLLLKLIAGFLVIGGKDAFKNHLGKNKLITNNFFACSH